MPPPTLAILRTGQQAIDDFFVGIGRAVNEKGVQFDSRRRQTDEIDRHSPEQRRLFHGRNGRQTSLFLLGGDECVDRIADHRDVFARRNWRPHRRLKRPMLPRVRRNRLIGGLRPFIDPPLEQLNLLGREWLAIFRHPLEFRFAGDRVEKQTFAALPGHNRRPALASFLNHRRRIKPQPRFLFERAVASKAIRL